MVEKNSYILGTDASELSRLELQHDVWLSEARKGWNKANFNKGQTILDLGCGPGSCSKELAKIVDNHGKIISIDKSAIFINHIKNNLQKEFPNIEPIESTFDNMNLQSSSIDGIFCRWSLAWISNPKEIIEKAALALKEKGRIVFHEYYNWSTHQIYPYRKNINKCIQEALKSFKDSEFEIDIGAYLPQILSELGLKIVSSRLMPKLASPKTNEWMWPKTFYLNYFPKLIKMGYLNENDVEKSLNEINELESLSYARICCPILIEIIAEK